MEDSKLLWVRFAGDGLKDRSVPIYELSDTLIAIQRIVQKVYLFNEQRLDGRAQLKKLERQNLSLQIVERRRGSDVWGLIPFITDPTVTTYVTELLKIGLGELAKYAAKQVLSGDSQTPNATGSALTGAIYAETVSITNHIYNIGGVDRIDLSMGAEPQAGNRVVTFNRETQAYVREIANQGYLGPATELSGAVTKLYPNRSIVEIRVEARRYVKVFVHSQDFDSVRYQTKLGDIIRFAGHARYRLGKEKFDEFLAESIVDVTSEDEF